MEDESSTDGFFLNKAEYKHVLMNWLLVVADLHSNHNRLVKHLKAYDAQQKSSEKSRTWIGQCPIGQLITLLNAIQQELEKLLVDIDLCDEPDSNPHKGHYLKLVSHTRMIKSLNQEANTMLKLAGLPSLRPKEDQ
ncbi:hypothetical protein [Spirosoma gilvum]